jgi:sialic acid synthase SpsE
MTNRVTLTTPLGEVSIGEGLPPLLIAEIGLNHNGSVELARQMIHQAALSGASMVKLQKRSPADLATATFLDAPFEKCPILGSTQRVVRERLELSLPAYIELKEYANSLGLIFFASAFDIPSLGFLQQAGVGIIKLASHSITNGPLLDAAAATGLPVICSVGGSTEAELDNAVARLSGSPLILMHCVSAYPTPDPLVKLDTIDYLKQRYQCPVGFSSHETGVDISIASTLLGACLVERHFTLDRAMIGLDQPLSLTPAEFAEMAVKIRRLGNARGVAEGLQTSEMAARTAYHVAVCAAQEIAAGRVITREMLVCKQPLGNIEHHFSGLQIDQVVGATAVKSIPADTPIERAWLGHG